MTVGFFLEEDASSEEEGGEGDFVDELGNDGTDGEEAIVVGWSISASVTTTDPSHEY